MKQQFKEFELSDSEITWLEAVLDNDFGKFSTKELKAKLWDDLSNDFDPEDFDRRFYRDHRITLVGLWHMDPQNELFNLCEKVILQIKRKIKKSGQVEDVEADEIGNQINVSPKKVGRAFVLIWDLGFFQGGSWFKGIYAFKNVDLWNNDNAYDKFLRFEGLETEMEQFFIEDKTKSSSGRMNFNNSSFNDGEDFVNEGRIEELQSLEADKFDFSRLIQLCLANPLG